MLLNCHSADHLIQPMDPSFHYQAYKNGRVTIYHHGRPVTDLSKDNARKFLRQMDSLGPDDQQRVMARVTGNYKRGNEKPTRLQ
ncbi:MAG: hypothetical protein KDI36_00415 [Pseudomonadales bacterium]|nr:hypothetical protein [Pseudomonadales bacterium]